MMNSSSARSILPDSGSLSEVHGGQWIKELNVFGSGRSGQKKSGPLAVLKMRRFYWGIA
jgi:hypothetical protein